MIPRTKNTACLQAVLSLLPFAFLPAGLNAQVNDSLKTHNVEFITDQLENIAQSADLNLDYTDLIDDYLYYTKNPLNLNSGDISKLLELHLINEMQLQSLMAYKKKYKQIHSIFELKYLPGFDTEGLQRLAPFVVAGPVKKQQHFSLKEVFKYGSHQFLMRYQQVIEPSQGYKTPSDSGWLKPGSAYLGNPQKWYSRYAFNFKNKVRFGFTLEKDAGEVFLKNQLGDSVQMLVGDKITNVFDFYSAHVYVSGIGLLKKAVIGDYHLEFGQGLTLWSGLAFGKSAETLQVERYGQGIRPNTSTNENRFFRGAAITLGLKGFSVTGFYSSNQVDAHIANASPLTEESISSMQETGLHRTINELLNKDVLKVQTYGGRIGYKKRFLEVGFSAFQAGLSINLLAGDELYKRFNFQGNRLNNYGTDIKLKFQKINFFGELSASSNGGLAGIAGLNSFLNDRFIFTLVYHNFGKDYQNLYANPFAETSTYSNEKGIYFGFRALLLSKWRLSAYVDYFQFPWLRYRTDGPSRGRDYLLQLDFYPSPNTKMYFRYRLKQKQENYSGDYSYHPLIAKVVRNEFRFFASYSVSGFLIFKNRIDFVFYSKEFVPRERGYQIYQDILFRPASFPLEATFRYALFDTDGYNSRIYTYENDVLYAFSVPAYFDKGQRVYLMLKWKAFSKLSVWLRLARVVYDNRTTIGSGAGEIEGNHRTEVKIQVRLKL